MKKRIADWCEKASVASFAIGVFQIRWEGMALAVIFGTISLYITHKTGGQ